MCRTWQFDPEFAAPGSWAISYTQSSTTTVLTVVRPIAHPQWPISTTGPTTMAFATGTAGSNTLSYHTSDPDLRGVSGRALDARAVPA